VKFDFGAALWEWK